ncbi:hypothetical protein ACHAXR_006749 [Thalassiosira sp. AJA248-18]
MCILLDEALDQWLALTGREEAYKVQPQPSAERQDEQKRKRDDPLSTHETLVHSCPPMWREKICEWCFQVVDHCDIDRDVVSTALSYFDRYLSCHTSVAENMFQLVAMTSLYLAVKLHSTRKISVYSISSLSKGHFRVDQILKCEICIIKSLRWHLNPPTPSIYLNVASPLIDASGNAHTSCEISELARYLLELSVCDGFFSDKKQSSIAYAAIIVAMENLSISKTVRGRFASYELDKSPHVTDICARRLRHVYSIALSTQPEEEQRAGSSPTSVAQG